jgi:predicted phosphoadenosine phosphosulfate sulfurtransferase
MRSDDLHDIELYPAAAVADSFLGFPGMRLLNPSTPSWWDWRARWESGRDFIEVGMTLFEAEVPTWGGSPISADCTFGTFDKLWSHIQLQHEAVWLHDDDCTIHTHDSFTRTARV